MTMKKMLQLQTITFYAKKKKESKNLEFSKFLILEKIPNSQF